MRAHCSILYFRHTTGCFVPTHQMHRDDGCEWHVARCVYAPLDGRQRVMVLHNGKICEEDGFMVQNLMRPETVAHTSTSSIAARGRSARPEAGEMYGFIGAHGENRFTKSPFHYRHVDPDYVLSVFHGLELPSEDYVGLAELVYEGAEQIGTSLLTAMQQLLGEDFPAPRGRIGMLLPKQPLGNRFWSCSCCKRCWKPQQQTRIRAEQPRRWCSRSKQRPKRISARSYRQASGR